ncbi:hypothetical protein COCC4DRAFT_65820 [Bipolaris maydis ATCC 48331]|uniref:DNA (cytosine-5-)-methyltransferase n=1 Tax=Cochliobolus heterostrophus (strain C4 / ATCC 48331 / race T) TaxID=665024 RepID=N4WLA6_COCH4|nr:uncharacterized protein COCC4DRAFT_65820 [Bipolaris maydis ATCC 48331]ENI00095.1 hypothetical protein COCC4DRAFT_65820 [Bipolaris maydis ATCC 48331]KAJ5029455.1 S-adenosyl-L-methionine-dependent methyltransferase [Bipolaris maydis]KAJ6275928.1 S-adenosyl-L-methionine-dependent methyltransferase [Bipolaris maydis]KAJ6287077.1 S-adenosyl-L-methionine-dependent methyltransferase [Bipolaris maydis]
MPALSDYAQSQATGWSPPAPVTPELKAIHDIKIEWKKRIQTTHNEHKREKQRLVVDLHNFEIYRSPDYEKRAYELACLHFLGLPLNKKLCFDGFVRLGNIEHYVQGVPFQQCSIKDYTDKQNPEVTSYIQSEIAANDKEYDIWYRLTQPTPQYQRLQDAFLWIAQLGKHVLHYMESASRSLACFREDFHTFLKDSFSDNRDFEKWHATFRNQVDFRVAVVTYIEYLYKEASHRPNPNQFIGQPLWVECMAKPVTPNNLRKTGPEQTVATPTVYACFKDMYFGKQIRPQAPSKEVLDKQETRKKKLGFLKTPSASLSYADLSKTCQPYGESQVMVGDVVAVVPDKEDSKLWKYTKRNWLAYVQRTQTLDNGIQQLFVVWLYWPHDTNIAKAYYPLENEVFLSDHCNCTERALLSTEVKGKYDIDWCPSIINAKRLFVRQKYITEGSSFVSMKDNDKTCSCHKETTRSPCATTYKSGDTVYLKPSKNHQLLEPVVIQQIDQKKGSVTVRKLLRLERDCAELAKNLHRSNIAPNELVLTDEYSETKSDRLERHCSIRFVSKSDVTTNKVPFPYNRQGAGHLWFISMGLSVKDDQKRLVYLRRLPCNVRQRTKIGLDTKLRGVSLFGGGGVLDRGLEEGGAVEFRTVVDSSQHAIRTQQANINNHTTVCLYCGSVNTFLDSALKGDTNFIVRVGDVDFIAAGCPCVAFSGLQQNPLSLSSLQNASLISTFCSFVDLYRPLYGVLENVLNISSERAGSALSQMVACLVSLGYQVSHYIMDSWNYGSAQRRSRAVVTIAAPGLQPIVQPYHTHSRSDEEVRSRSLGQLPNGEFCAGRQHYPTPFYHVPAETVSSGLPNIGYSTAQTCIPYPDHRIPNVPTRKDRALLDCIPKEPPGCGYKEAEDLGLIPLHLRRKREIGKSYQRIKKDGLVPTITTGASISDSRNGAVMHWEEPRTISLQEARRAQGIPDAEPIIGTIRDQWRIAGNGVDRKVGFAIGLGLLQAVESNDLDTKSILQQAHAKRTREEDFDSSKRPKKQARTSMAQDATANLENREISVDPVRDSRQSLTGSTGSTGSTGPTKARYTRHSGLPVEFVPKNWSKKVEAKRRDQI